MIQERQHPTLRVLRVSHGGRGHDQRARERAIVAAGIELTLVVPDDWPSHPKDEMSATESFQIRELVTKRSGDVNRHGYADRRALERLIADTQPDVLDIHEEPFSVSAHQCLAAAPPNLPVVMYTAQNVDKRFPPPFSRYERQSYDRVSALYPCSSQAASVARGKGFSGEIEVLPLGFDDRLFYEGSQSIDDEEIVFGLFGRLVPEKGVLDAVRVVARVNETRSSRLVVVGQGPEEERARKLAASLGLAGRFEFLPWLTSEELAVRYRSTHVALVPSRPTSTWVEQFGRVIVEAQASGAIVAGYRNGAIAEVGGAAALLVDTGDEQGLARVVSALVQDRETFNRGRSLGLASTAFLTWSAIGRRQADLYENVATRNQRRRVELPRSPALRRKAARVEFGPTAATVAGERPFAVPFLRRGGRLADSASSAIDLAAEVLSRLRAAR